MKTIVQIVGAAIVVMACARGADAAWRYYQFQDAVEREVRFGHAKTTSQLHQRVMELAEQNKVAVTYADVAVDPRDGQTVVSVTYVEPITLVPAVYTRNQHFDFEVSIRAVRPLVIDEK